MTSPPLLILLAALCVPLSGCAPSSAAADETAPPAAATPGDGGVAPPSRPPKAKNVPPHVFEEQKISGEMPHLPDLVKIKYKGHGLSWMGKVCLGAGGVIDHVSIVSGIPEADGVIVTTLRGWRYRPQPQPICTLIRFEFSLR